MNYNSRHLMVKRARGKAIEHKCDCGNQAKEWATIHGKDGSDPSHYQPMCHSCHKKYDYNPANIEAATKAKIGKARPDLSARNKARSGWSHTEEARARIAAGMRKYRQQQSAAE